MQNSLIEKGKVVEIYLKEDGFSPEDVALIGKIPELNILDVFEFIINNHKTGVFYFFNEAKLLRRFYFEKGALIFTTSQEKSERLGEVLLKEGLITEEALRECEKSLKPGVKLGAVLVSKKFLTPKELFEGVKAQIRAIIQGALQEKSGIFYFASGSFLQHNLVHFSINTKTLLMECIKSVDEMGYIKKLVESGSVKISQKASDRIPPVFFRALSLISQGLSLSEVADITGVEENEILSLLLKLKHEGLLVTSRPGQAGESKLWGDRSNLEVFISDVNSALMDAFSILAVKIGEEEALRRLNTFFDDLPEEFQGLFKGIKIGSEGALDVKKLMSNVESLKHLSPVERAKLLKKGLRELFNFATFELLNAGGREVVKPFEKIMKVLEMEHG